MLAIQENIYFTDIYIDKNYSNNNNNENMAEV